jgi:hypothetical protein
MRFDESQSKGLKNYLMNEMELQICEALQTIENNLDNHKSTHASINGFNRLVEDLRSRLNKFSICHYVGFNHEKKYVAFSQIEPSGARSYNTWEEKCLYAHNILLSQGIFEDIMGSYNVSEHTLTRIFQRKNFPDNFDTNKDIFSALKELKYLPAYAAYWNRFSLNFTNNLGIKKFDVVVPAPSGIFIAEINDPKVPMLEVRTFLSLEMLDSHQKLLRNIYIDAIKDILDSPLPYFLLYDMNMKDTVELEAKILSGKLIDHFEIMFNKMISVEDATLGFDWSTNRLKEMMDGDALRDNKVIQLLPLHPFKRDALSRKMKLKSYVDL